jgi:hypothetical protein
MPVAKKTAPKTATKSKKAVAKKPAAKAKLKVVKTKADTAASELKMKEGDKVLWLNGKTLSAGTVMKATAKTVSVAAPGASKATLDVNADDVLAVCNPAGLKTPDAITLMPFSGQGFLTASGHAYVAKNAQPERTVQGVELHCGDTVELVHFPFGYTKHDPSLTVGNVYDCSGFLGELVITTSDVPGEFAMYHQDHVDLVQRWKKAA